MKRFSNYIAALVGILLLTGGIALASERYLGVIVSTNAASKNNLNTAAPFTIGTSTPDLPIKLSLQCDVDTYINSAGCASSACAATANDTKILFTANPHFIYDVTLGPGETSIATLGVTATSTCKVRRVYP